MPHPNKGKTFPPEVLTGAEVLRLMAACSNGFCGVRTRAMIAIMYRAGLRHSEVLDLEPKDLDPVSRAVRVLHGKGDKMRVVGMDAAGFGEVARWIQVRDPNAAKLFHTRTGLRVSSQHMRQALPRLARRAGIEKRVHAHGFRHTLASELRQEGEDIGIISKQLGHSSISTTATYLDHIAPARVIDAVGGREWEK